MAEVERRLDNCHCGSKVLMRYEPGCTYLLCIRENRSVAAVPDRDPEGLLESWND